MNSLKSKFSRILSPDSRVEMLWAGFLFTEGPLWSSAEKALLFSDIDANRIYKWSPVNGTKVFRDPSGNSNGLTYDKEGRLIICEHGNRRVSRIEKNGTYTVLVDRFRGKRLNSPNDVIVKSDGAIYFTDPPYGIKPEDQELSFQGVFRFDPNDSNLTLLVDDFSHPNGIVLSPDETVLYVGDSGTDRHIRVFDLKDDGKITNGRVFAEIRSEGSKDYPDGIKVDVQGNLYVTAPDGILVYSKESTLLGVIKTSEWPANCTWGDNDRRSLFITARSTIYRVKLNIPGV